MSWRSHEAIFNSADDKDLFTDPRTRVLHTPKSVLGDVPDDPGDVIRAMREHGFLPVFEGKHVDQFLVGIKPIRWWLSIAQAKAKYGKEPRPDATLVFRETARNTDERTCIAAVLPERSAASHKLSGVLLERVESNAAAALLNSFCFDYALRMRTAGTNVSFTYIGSVAVPPAHVVNRLPKIPTLLAWESGVGHITDREDLWPTLWQLNRSVAEAYGLTAGDFSHILDSFPGVAKKRKEFFAFLKAKTLDWIDEGMERSTEDSRAVAEPGRREPGRHP